MSAPFGPNKRIVSSLKSDPNPKQTEIISGGDHFFRGQEKLVAQLTADFFNNTL